MGNVDLLGSRACIIFFCPHLWKEVQKFLKTQMNADTNKSSNKFNEFDKDHHKLFKIQPCHCDHVDKPYFHECQLKAR